MVRHHQHVQATALPALQVIDLIATGNGATFAPAGCIASAIVELIKSTGDCLPRDLIGKGFTTAEIESHWHMAHSLAAVELKIMNKKEMNQKRNFETQNTAIRITRQEKAHA